MRLLARMAALAFVAALAWSAGLAWFIRAAERTVPPPAHADGIVALTGGAGRVEAGLRLLAEGRADRLLLSGIGGGAELPEFARLAQVDAGALADRVTLGRAATTTLGNADEAAAWVRANGVRSLIVVTAGYHMARALTELSRALPGVTLYAMPVQPPATAHGVGDPATLRLMAEEYTKYLAVALGLHAGPRPEPGRPELGRPELGRPDLGRPDLGRAG